MQAPPRSGALRIISPQHDYRLCGPVACKVGKTRPRHLEDAFDQRRIPVDIDAAPDFRRAKRGGGEFGQAEQDKFEYRKSDNFGGTIFWVCPRY